MNPLSFTSISSRCSMFECWSADAGSSLTPSHRYDVGLPRSSIGDEIVDFLDGRTNGEGLLHALYDYILDEPVPTRMREVLRSETAGSAR